MKAGQRGCFGESGTCIWEEVVHYARCSAGRVLGCTLWQGTGRASHNPAGLLWRPFGGLRQHPLAPTVPSLAFCFCFGENEGGRE